MNQQQMYDPRELGLTVKMWSGDHEVLCACPWHGGSDSLCVNLLKGVFICYACGERGGIRKLVTQTGGIPVWQPVAAPSRNDRAEEYQKLLECDLAFDDDYLKGRGVTRQQIEKYEIRRNKRSIIIPMRDPDGNVCGALLRNYEGFVRYLVVGDKPPIWPILSPSDVAASTTRVIVTEGVFGAMSAERAGFFGVATLGAMFKKTVVPLLRTTIPVISYDSDRAGVEGTARLVRQLGCPFIDPSAKESDMRKPHEWVELVNQATRNGIHDWVSRLHGHVG